MKRKYFFTSVYSNNIKNLTESILNINLFPNYLHNRIYFRNFAKISLRIDINKNSDMTIAQIFDKKIKRTKDTSLLFASDFPQYDQNYIGDLLSLYVREGKLIRLANGVYLKTTMTQFGPVFPSPTEIAEAISRRDHAKVLMSGLDATVYFLILATISIKRII